VLGLLHSPKGLALSKLSRTALQQIYPSDNAFAARMLVLEAATAITSKGQLCARAFRHKLEPQNTAASANLCRRGQETPISTVHFMERLE
jgi:hypothetical protein